MEFISVCKKYLGWCPNAPAIRTAPASLWSHLKIFILHNPVMVDLPEVLTGSGMGPALLSDP